MDIYDALEHARNIRPDTLDMLHHCLPFGALGVCQVSPSSVQAFDNDLEFCFDFVNPTDHLFHATRLVYLDPASYFWIQNRSSYLVERVRCGRGSAIHMSDWRQQIPQAFDSGQSSVTGLGKRHYSGLRMYLDVRVVSSMDAGVPPVLHCTSSQAFNAPWIRVPAENLLDPGCCVAEREGPRSR